MAAGKFITFEGVDGSGKSTQIDLFSEFLTDAGIPYKLIREPGGTVLGEKIRALLLTKNDSSICDETELLLFEASRAQLVREVIRPLLQQGVWVICDRFADSTVAYQGYGRGLDLEMIERLNVLALDGISPDLTFLLQMTDENGDKRLQERGKKGDNDRIDNEDRLFKQRVSAGFTSLAEKYPQRICRVSTDVLPTETLAAIIQKVRSVLL